MKLISEYKVGDKVLCKADYILKHSVIFPWKNKEETKFLKGKTYEITKITNAVWRIDVDAFDFPFVLR